jgi:hypothetical protein
VQRATDLGIVTSDLFVQPAIWTVLIGEPSN